MQVDNSFQYSRDKADSSGYTGDEEEDVRTTASSDDDDLFLRRTMKSSPFFHVAPRKRKRKTHDPPSGNHSVYRYDTKAYQLPFEFRSPPPLVPYRTSLYLLSRFLTQHMAQTSSNTTVVQQASEEPPWRPNDKSTDSAPSILSEEHLQLDEALSFSLQPRYVISNLEKFPIFFRTIVIPHTYHFLKPESSSRLTALTVSFMQTQHTHGDMAKTRTFNSLVRI